MTRLSIKASLILIFTAIIFCCGVMAYIANSGLASTNGSTREIATNWLPSVTVVSAINTATSDYRIAEGAHVLSTSDAEMSKAEADQQALAKTIDRLRQRYEPLISTDRERETYAEFSRQWRAYADLDTTLINLSRQNKNDEAATLFKGEMRKPYDDASNALVALIDINNKGADNAYIQSQAAFTNTQMISYSVLVLVGAVLIGSIVFAIKGISGPIQRITSAMQNLAKGDTSSEVPFSKRTDEIGLMASAVAVFRANMISNERLEQQVAANRSAAETNLLTNQERIVSEAEQLRVATSALGENLKRLSSGDLTCRIDAQFAEEYEALRADFNATVDQLCQTIGGVSMAVGNMDSGTREIATGAEDLSKRTEQQAASLEETAAALDEITANVSSSSKLTEEARQVAVQANHAAVKSAQVVSHAENAMGKIEQSSQQISNIIGVIDEIAFQTNLLALNAGVEAARAGDAGRGFAVVAQEVRELAQRSAQAAKEIKGLIRTSSAEVEGGVKLVRETGEALKTIGSFIAQINIHMESIAVSAKEQTTGLSEINVAVNSMDQATQQNAAMVEQTTAAAGTLANEASKLRDLVGRFQLVSTTGNRTARLRQTSRTMPTTPVASAKKVANGWQDF